MSISSSSISYISISASSKAYLFGNVTSQGRSFSQNSSGTAGSEVLIGNINSNLPGKKQYLFGYRTHNAVITNSNNKFNQNGSIQKVLDNLFGQATSQLNGFTQTGNVLLVAEQVNGILTSSLPTNTSLGTLTAGPEVINGQIVSSLPLANTAGTARVQFIVKGELSNSLPLFRSYNAGEITFPDCVINPFEVSVNGVLRDEFIYDACLTANIQKITTASIGGILSSNTQTTSVVNKSAKLSATIINILEAHLCL